MSVSKEFITARRRYRALLREQKSLAAAEAGDELVNSELAKLEAQFPQLKELDANPTPDAAGEKTTAEPTAATSPPRLPSLFQSGQTPPQFTCGTEGVAASAESQPTNTEIRRPSPAEVKRPPEGIAASLFVLRLYNETHQRSVFGPVNFMKMMVMGALNAAFHFFVANPCTPLGAQLVPSVFCSVAHLYILYSLFLKRRARFSVPMLLVYSVLDFIPSMVSAFVAYTVTLSSLSLAFSRKVSFQC